MTTSWGVAGDIGLDDCDHFMNRSGRRCLTVQVRPNRSGRSCLTVQVRLNRSGRSCLTVQVRLGKELFDCYKSDRTEVEGAAV